MAPQINPALQAISQQIDTLLEAKDLDALRVLLKAEHPADIADLLITITTWARCSGVINARRTRPPSVFSASCR